MLPSKYQMYLVFLLLVQFFKLCEYLSAGFMCHHERPREVSQQRSTVGPNLWEGGGPRRIAVEGWVGFFLFVHTRLRPI